MVEACLNKPDFASRLYKVLNRTTSAVFLIALLALASIGILHTVFSRDGVLQWLRLRREVVKLSAENQALKAENDRLRQEADRLVSDRQYIERAVREQLGYARANELIFRFGSPVTSSPR